MRKRSNFFSIFLLSFLVSVGILVFFQTQAASGIRNVLQRLTMPFQQTTYRLFGNVLETKDERILKLEEENKRLRQQIVKSKNDEAEIKALQDQFKVEKIAPDTVLPARVIGAKTFIPGVSYPEQITIDKGTHDNVQVGSIVIYKDNLIGSVEKAYSRSAVVRLITSKSMTFTGRTLKTNALGVVYGLEGRMMALGNVVLSEKLEANDLVITKGDVDGEKGFPPDLVVGKIKSVSKRPSALFQVAEVESLVDMVKVTNVFVMRNK